MTIFQRMYRRPIMIVAAVAILGYLGWGTVPSGAQTPWRVAQKPGAKAGKPAATVTMDAVNFIPKQVTVKVGDTVAWKNTSKIVHTVTADPKQARDPKNVSLPKGAKTFDSGNMNPEDAFTHTFPVAGTYKYICVPHEVAGMVGEVVVKQ